MSKMKIQDILFDEQSIARRVDELAGEISRDYADRDVLLVCVLKAAFIFTADLARRITRPVEVAFVQASSYGGGTVSSGKVAVGNLDCALRGRHVLLVDTIIDTGATMARLHEIFRREHPASLATVCLLDKECRRTTTVPVSYRGFVIPDLFVAGYGMDCGGRFRNLPSIASIRTPQE